MNCNYVLCRGLLNEQIYETNIIDAVNVHKFKQTKTKALRALCRILRRRVGCVANYGQPLPMLYN